MIDMTNIKFYVKGLLVEVKKEQNKADDEAMHIVAYSSQGVKLPVKPIDFIKVSSRIGTLADELKEIKLTTDSLNEAVERTRIDK